ncbi:MAG: hypothetical protein ACE5KM_03160 [Planctomycetaceae bacterium]
MLRKNNERADEFLCLIGGLGCLGLSWLDAGWSGFWLAAGVILILWSVGSFLYAKLRR